MTEEIIINCGWYRNGWCGCETEDKKCEQIKLCKFKVDKLKQQLKRLEQERDELKKACGKCKLFDIEKTNRDLLERIDKLEQENKALQAYKDINEDFKKAWDELNEKYKQLRSALEEIKKYVTKWQGLCFDEMTADELMKICEVLECQ